MGIYDLWKFTSAEQQELLGTDIGDEVPAIVVELDEWSRRMFYNERFAPLLIKQYVSNYPYKGEEIFQIILSSIDDASINMIWSVKNMDVRPDEARQLLANWLQRSNYFINLRGLEAFCEIFGKYQSNNN